MSAKRVEDDATVTNPPGRETEKWAPQPSVPLKKGFGLRGKMFALFFIIPITLIIASSVLYIWQLNTLSYRLGVGSTEMVSRLNEEALTARAQGVAAKVKLYLTTHPELKKQMFYYDINFRSIAMQKERTGTADYTALYEKPGEDGIWRTWVHANPNIIGIDMATLKTSLGASFDGFWKVYTGVKNQPESKGFYDWRDADGVMRKKYMVCVGVEGTPYVIAATGYVEEVTDAIKFMQKSAAEFALRTRYIVLGILGGTLILIGFIVAWYGYRLTEKIRYLTDITDRISVGDLDAEITGIKSQDEIGELAHAISRMQSSIRLAIKRLRERR